MFKPWPKILRLEKKRKPVFTEKIDGTNACIIIQYNITPDVPYCAYYTSTNSSPSIVVVAQSRTRLITPTNDNFGFAKWVKENSDNLLSLGEGYHYGEWWGLGIQRDYGLQEKRFSLFNTRRWGEHNPNTPKCCHVIPTLPVTTAEEAIDYLKTNGSLAVPGWMKPEGAVMYEPDSDTCFKIILDK